MWELAYVLSLVRVHHLMVGTDHPVHIMYHVSRYTLANFCINIPSSIYSLEVHVCVKCGVGVWLYTQAICDHITVDSTWYTQG